MTGIVGIRTPLFHHCYVRPSSPTIITIGARHPLATKVQRSTSPRRNVARQHRHIVTTQPPNHQFITSFNDTRRRLHSSRQHLEPRLYCGLLQQQEDYSRRPRKEEERSQRRKPEERRQKTKTQLLQQNLANCGNLETATLNLVVE